MKNLFFLILSPFFLLAGDHGPLFSWTKDPLSRFNVTWISSSAESQTLSYNKADTHITLFSQVHPFADTDHFVHRVELKNLEAEQVYKIEFFQSQFASGKEYFVKTMPKRLPKNLSFVVGGDMMHQQSLCEKMNSQAAKLQADFALLGGDLAYANGRSAKRWYIWFDTWAKSARRPDGLSLPVILVIGNHEVRGGYDQSMKEAPYFYSLFSFPNKEAFYSVDFADYLSIIVLDSQHSKKISEQKIFLKKSFEERKEKPYLFVSYHFPAYGILKKGLKNPISKEIHRHWLPLFEQYQPDALFENDHHIYKRSKLMYQGKENKQKGLLYIGDGAWGVSTRWIPAKENWPNYVAQALSRRHLIHVSLNSGIKKYTAYSAEGDVLDFFLDQRVLRD